jgi:hypothetical protein
MKMSLLKTLNGLVLRRYRRLFDMDNKRLAAKDLTANNVYRRFYFINDKMIHLEWLQEQEGMTSVGMLIKDGSWLESFMDRELDSILDDLSSYNFVSDVGGDAYVRVEKGNMVISTSADISSKSKNDFRKSLMEFFRKKGFFYSK